MSTQKQKPSNAIYSLLLIPFLLYVSEKIYDKYTDAKPPIIRTDSIPKVVQKVDSNSGQVNQQSGTGNTSVQQSGTGNRNNSPNINNSKTSKQEIKGKNVVVGTNKGIVGDVSINTPKLFSQDGLNGIFQILTDFQNTHPSAKIYLGKTIDCNSQDAFNQVYNALKESKLNFQSNVNLEGITSPIALSIDTSTPNVVRVAIGVLK